MKPSNSGLKRRDFLRAAAVGSLAAGVGTLAGCSDESTSPKPKGPRIAIIGAGLAGLATALELQASGFDHLVVLEARDEVGGRVRTLRNHFSGLRAELGATWFVDTHAALQRWVHRYRLPLIAARSAEDSASLRYRYFVRGHSMDVGSEDVDVRFEGQSATAPFMLPPEEEEAGLFGLRARYIEPAIEAYRSLDPMGPEARAIDARNLGEHLRSLGASEEAIEFMRLGLYDDWGDGADAVSALLVLRDGSMLPNSALGYRRLEGGSDRLPKAMADDLRKRLGDEALRLGRPLQAIVPESDRVRLRVGDGGAEEIVADRVVCTLPFSVLRSIEGIESFSAPTRRAIKSLSYTSILRTSFQTESRFWRDAGVFGDSITDLDVQAVFESSVHQPGRAGILQSYTAGARARALAALSPRERRARIVGDIERIHPGFGASIRGEHTMDWDADPHARGAFAWFRPGQLCELSPLLGQAEGRVHFAGEHCSPCPGWMEGALMSADRVVEEIVATERA